MHLLPGEHGEILGRQDVGGKSGVLGHNSGNIPETRKKGKKFHHGGSIETHLLRSSSGITIPDP